MESLQDPGSGYGAFTDLKTWQQCRKIKLLVREFVKSFPDHERYRLADQVIRSSRSVAANIAEGHGRRTPKDEMHFCVQSRGSLSETFNHVIDALDEGFISEAQFNIFKTEFKLAEKMLNGYIKYLKAKP